MRMNKQKNRYTPFAGEYKMPVDEFCRKYGLSLKVVMHRMNVLYWDDFDSLVIPQELGDATADKIRRTLMLINQQWSKDEIVRRMRLSENIVDKIANMDEYRKNMFLTMENYFFLDPAKVDLTKIFKEVEFSEA